MSCTKLLAYAHALPRPIDYAKRRACVRPLKLSPSWISVLGLKTKRGAEYDMSPSCSKYVSCTFNDQYPSFRLSSYFDNILHHLIVAVIKRLIEDYR